MTGSDIESEKHIPWYYPQPDSLGEMQTPAEEFGGFRMGHHRADHILEGLDRGPEYIKQHNPEFNEGRDHTPPPMSILARPLGLSVSAYPLSILFMPCSDVIHPTFMPLDALLVLSHLSCVPSE